MSAKMINNLREGCGVFCSDHGFKEFPFTAFASKRTMSSRYADGRKFVLLREGSIITERIDD
jgi:hypothetical protein